MCLFCDCCHYQKSEGFFVPSDIKPILVYTNILVNTPIYDNILSGQMKIRP